MNQIQTIKAKIERLKEQSIKSLTDGKKHNQFEYDVACGYENALIELKSFIESLEKEQDTMPNSTELIAKWEDTKKMLEEKDFRSDEWRLAYNAFLEGFAKGINVKKPSVWIREQVGDRDDDDSIIAEKLRELHQTQKEKEQDVDLEKEIIRYKIPFQDDREYLNETTLDAIAYHFFELGKTQVI